MHSMFSGSPNIQFLGWAGSCGTDSQKILKLSTLKALWLRNILEFFQNFWCIFWCQIKLIPKTLLYEHKHILGKKFCQARTCLISSKKGINRILTPKATKNASSVMSYLLWFMLCPYNALCSYYFVLLLYFTQTQLQLFPTLPFIPQDIDLFTKLSQSNSWWSRLLEFPDMFCLLNILYLENSKQPFVRQLGMSVTHKSSFLWYNKFFLW